MKAAAATSPKKSANPKPAAFALNFLTMYQADPMERINIVKRGMSARSIEVLATRMAVSKDRIVATLGLARATVDRRVRDNKPLSADDSARVLGMARLVGQVQQMVDESGDPEGFDAAAWVAQWLEKPLPATPSSLPQVPAAGRRWCRHWYRKCSRAPTHEPENRSWARPRG